MGIEAIGSAPTSAPNSLVQLKSIQAHTPASKASESAPHKAGAAPPAGSEGAAAAAKAAAASSSPSNAKIYDIRDTNKDGVVSSQEALAFSLQHPADETQNQQPVSNSQVQTGLNAYQQNQQASSAAGSTFLSKV